MTVKTSAELIQRRHNKMTSQQACAGHLPIQYVVLERTTNLYIQVANVHVRFVVYFAEILVSEDSHYSL